MKTKWTSLIVGGAVLALLSSQVMAQPWGGGPGRGRGAGRGQGMGMMAGRPGAMRQGMGPGGDGVCPFGLEPGAGRQFDCPIGPGQGAGFGRLAGRLELTDEQKTAIQGIFEQAQPEVQAAREAVAAARNALQEAVKSGAAEEQIRAAGSALGTAIGNQAAVHARTQAAAKAVLTAEQVQELDKIRETLPQGGGRMQSRGMGPGFGPGRAVQPPADGPATVGATRLEAMFEAADADKDGLLSLEELQTFHGTMRGGRPFRGR